MFKQGRQIIQNAKGQMAIFVALIFQVLFVLFAMAINVALIVHDKVNLQNSVDLAAYYAAAKQAEILNAIAHQNYQIRQAYKLYTWRVRVLGTLGMYQAPGSLRHPTAFPPGSLGEVMYPGAGLDLSTAPKACIIFAPSWTDTPGINTPGNLENLCQNRSLQVPPLPKINPAASWVPINAVIASVTDNLARNFVDTCKGRGSWNWWYVNAAKMAYRQDQANRKDVIYALANSLSRTTLDIIDLNGDSVMQGVVNTINKNLTHSNFNGQGAQISFFNSLGQQTQNGKPNWLSEIKINTTSYYTDFNTAGGGCSAINRPESQDPQEATTGGADWAFIQNQIGGQLLRDYVVNPEPSDSAPNANMRMSLGVEKNPWVMAYVGVKATTQSRQIFHPIGEPVTITAEAYAKPFGGRIGPWFSASWPRGAVESSGSPIDPLAPPRTQQNGLLDSPDDPRRIPNYSRFPGDELGLSSVIAQASLTNFLQNFKIRRDHLKATYATINNENAHNDPLAWDVDNNQQASARSFELAAIAPDLFDITYYSIEPNYWINYGRRIEANRGALGLPPDLILRPDLGYHRDVPQLANFSVQDQMSLAAGLHSQQAFYYVRDKEHLLTGWVPGETTNMFPPATAPEMRDLFANCQKPDKSGEENNPAPTNPGSCIWGGRTGYSVKIISRDYVYSQNLNLGGNGVGAGPILNPPQNF